MKYRQARKFVMPFGSFEGSSLEKIAQTDEGLLYLDWITGQDFVQGPLKDALTAFLSDATIQRELENLLGER